MGRWFTGGTGRPPMAYTRRGAKAAIGRPCVTVAVRTCGFARSASSTW